MTKTVTTKPPLLTEAASKLAFNKIWAEIIDEVAKWGSWVSKLDDSVVETLRPIAVAKQCSLETCIMDFCGFVLCLSLISFFSVYLADCHCGFMHVCVCTCYAGFV